MSNAKSTARVRLWRVFQIAYLEMFDFADPRQAVVRLLLAPLFVVPTVVLVSRLVRFDHKITTDGVISAMRWILNRYYGGVEVVCGRVPAAGPLLLVGNHPGLGDLPALAVAAARPDLFAIAKQRALMDDMCGLLSRCVVIDHTLGSRARSVRQIVAIARSGGAIVVYPSGLIEPDPALVGDDQPILGNWFSFVDGIARRLRREGLAVPIVPVYTESVHVIPPFAQRFAYRRGSGRPHEGRAALITMVTRRARSHAIKIAFGDPIAPQSGPLREITDGNQLTDQVRAALDQLRAVVRGSATAASQVAEKAVQVPNRVAAF